MPRPVIGPWDFASDKAYLMLALVVLAACALGVAQLSRGTTDRKLRALGGSDIAAQAPAGVLISNEPAPRPSTAPPVDRRPTLSGEPQRRSRSLDAAAQTDESRRAG